MSSKQTCICLTHSVHSYTKCENDCLFAKKKPIGYHHGSAVKLKKHLLPQLDTMVRCLI